MDEANMKKLLDLRYLILDARNHTYLRNLDKAQELVDRAIKLNQEMWSEASSSDFNFYKIIWIGLGNAKECLLKRLRTISMVELFHISEIPILLIWDKEDGKRREYYLNIVKTEYERQSKREMVERFHRTWDNLSQKKT